MSSPKTIWDKFRDPEYAYAYFDEFLNTYIATQIKAVREQRGYSQEKLASLAGMKQERISVLENVNYTSWSVNTLRRIAKALGLRLKVSLETFGSGLPEIRNFDAKHLQRKSLAEELSEYDQIRDQLHAFVPNTALATAGKSSEQTYTVAEGTARAAANQRPDSPMSDLLPGFLAMQRKGAAAAMGNRL